MTDYPVHEYEVVRQFRYDVPGMNEQVSGEIRRQLSPKPEGQAFHWWISHHYKPTAGAGTYYPSLTSGESEKEVASLLQAYALSFTAEHGVTKNGA